MTLNSASSASVITLDCDYVFPKFAAAFLVKEGKDCLFVENNTAHANGKLLQALEQEGFSRSAVKYVIITHVHLDHAGGTGALMQACPNAKLLAHPRAAPHMIDPTKLVGAARQVYGDEVFDRLYGALSPVAQDRVKTLEDGETLQFGRRTLTFLHTRGHANHHFCVLDSGSDGIFTGDSFGLAYPAIQNRGLFVFPSTSPTDFNPDDAIASVKRIASSGAKRAYLTHFGEVKNLKEAERQLVAHLEFSGDLLNEAIHSSLADDELDAFCETKWKAHLEGALVKRGLGLHEELLKMDIALNGQGIAHVARKRRGK